MPEQTAASAQSPADSHMDECMKHAAPSDGHKPLDAFVGTWDAHVTFWMPDAPPCESDGVMVNAWILGGRYLEQRYRGEIFGAQFEGRGYFGFNNATKKYEGFWIDTACTNMSNEVGDYDPPTRTFTMDAPFINPADGSSGSKRTLIKVISADEHTMDTFAPGPDGKLSKMMAIHYKRKK